MQSSIVILAGLIASHSLYAQAPKGTARLSIEAPTTIVQGAQGKIDIKLLNAQGQPTAASKDVKLRIDAPGTAADQQSVTIPKGATSAEVAVSKATPGFSDIHVEQADAPADGLKANAQIGFSPAGAYTPVGPLGLRVSVQPNTKLKAGLETAKIVVTYLDSHKVPVPASNDIQIAFPGLSEISPNPIQIASGALFGEADVAATRPEVIALNPIPAPPMSVVSDTPSVEFDSPIVGLRVIADPPYTVRIRRPKIALKIGLVDAKGNWIASDEDRTVDLHQDPPESGFLAHNLLTIPKGASVAETTFVPSGEGKFMINAIMADGLVVEPAIIEFKYAYIYFWIIAVAGGLAGGIVKCAAGANHEAKYVVIHSLSGMGTGLLVYLLLPLLVSLSLRPVDLQNASKVFEAFAWGFIGGGTGTALLARIFSQVQAAPAHAPASFSAAGNH
jgi:hypothetical protein